MVEGFPGRGRDSQPTVLLSGNQRTLLQEVSMQLFGERAVAGDGVVIASARGDPALVGDLLSEHVGAFAPDRVALVDCCDGTCGSAPRPSDRRWDVPSPLAFADVEAGVESARRTLDDRDVGRRHFLFDTLTTQFRLAADPGAVLEHADDLAMTLGAETGLTVFAVDPATVTDDERRRLQHLFDVNVEVRSGDGDVELRWTGLVGGSDGWVPLADAGIRFEPLQATLG